MAKKHKAPDNNNNNNKNNLKSDGDSNPGSGSGSSSIFKTLFGDIPEQSSVSIFSDDNPFRRKPGDRSQTPHQQQPQQQRKQPVELGFGSAEDVGNTESPNFVEVKKRKRGKEKKPSLDSDSIDEPSETPLQLKKSKRDERKSSDIVVESEKRGEGENKLGFDSMDALKRGKGKMRNLGLESREASKKGKGKDPKLGMELEELPKKGEEDNQNMVLELNETETRDAKGTEKKKKKKRRREEELEAEYEARRLGFVTISDEGGEGALGGKLVGRKRKNVDDPVAMVVSKEGFDDEAKLLRTVFVGNLPLKVKKKSVLKEFSQFGEVESVRIRSVPLLDSKKPRKGAIIQKKINDSVDSVHAYIVFKTEQSAQASLAHNMAVVGGNHIRVDRACPPRKKLKGENSPLYDSKRTVFVGNLPFDVKDEEIYQLFSGIRDLESSIEAIRVIRDPGTSAGKGIAYILFKTRGAANLVVKKRSLKLRDRELRLTHARSNVIPSKRKNQSPRERDGSSTKKFAVDPRTPDSYNNRLKIKDASSYQGLRASKSGVQKKVHPRFAEPVKLKYGTHKGDKPKERSTKRPAVAARKVANALNGGGSSKQTGKKRKLENRTPQIARPNKKTKKFR